MAKQNFGGPWTILKLNVLKEYIQFYTTALKKQNFKLVYIDAFAGTGTMNTQNDGQGLFETQDVDGSAKIALDNQPNFDHYVFIEKSKHRLNKLRSIADNRPNVEFYIGDANLELEGVLSKFDWSSTRAVIFLDPYGLGVHWETLRQVAETEAIDVWYLVNTLSMSRQLAKDFSALEKEPYKAELIDKIWGTTDWRNVLYSEPVCQQLGMFSGEEHSLKREGGNVALDEFSKSRLADVFPYVLNPKPLYNRSGHQIFSLFFCVSNPSQKAIGLSIKAANYILNKH